MQRFIRILASIELTCPLLVRALLQIVAVVYAATVLIIALQGLWYILLHPPP
jgi:hypothetical protein